MNARVEGAKATSDMIYQLATLLRYTANHREITTLGEEINYVKQYVRFMEMRHEQPIKLEINIEKRFNHTQIQGLLCGRSLKIFSNMLIKKIKIQ